MEKPALAIGFGDTTSYNAVFVDTSIGTHLATVVSNSDFVADLKEKIMHEHPACFPQIGEIKIHALKVRRRGWFYYLSESMLVKSAFRGVNKSWFISADTSIVKVNDDNGHSMVAHLPKFNNVVACIAAPSNGSADGVNLSPHNHPEKLSDDVDNHHLNLKAPPAGLLCLEVADRDFIENLEVRAENIGDDHNKVKSLDEEKGSDPHIPEKDDEQCDDKNEIQKTTTATGGWESDSKNGIDDVQGQLLPEKALDAGSLSNKKRKSKKRNKHVRELALKETVASLAESDKHEPLPDILVSDSSLQNPHQLVSHHNVTRNKNITGGPGVVSYSDANKGTCYAVQRVATPSEGTSLLVEDASRAKPVAKRKLEDTSQAEHVVRKKCKIEEESKDGEDIRKDDEMLMDNSHKELIEPRTISQHSLVDRQKIKNATLDGSPTETPEAVHLQSVDPSSGKRKRKKKSSDTLNQEIAAVPSPVTDVREKIPVNTKDLGEEKLVPGKYDQGVTDSKPGAVSLKYKCGDPVQDVNIRCSSQEFDINKADIGNVESGHNVSRSAIASDAKLMRFSKDCQATNVEGNPHLEVQESHETEKDIGTSQHENMIFNESHVADQTGRIEERESALNFTPKSAPLEKYKASDQDELDLKTSVTEYPAKSSKKRKKSKNKKQLASATPFTSITEHIQGFISGLSPTEPHKLVNGDHSGHNVNEEGNNVPPKEGTGASEIDKGRTFLATDKEIDDVIQNAVKAVQQIGKGQVDAENIGVTSRKKTKKWSADAKNIPESEKVNENVGNKVPASSPDNTREVEYLSKEMKQANLANKDSIIQLNGSKLEGGDTRVEDELIGTQLKISSEGRHLEAVASGNLSKSGHANELSDDAEISSESNRINFNEYFVPRQHSHEVLVDRTTEVKRTDSEMKTKKKKKKHNAQNSNENHEVEVKPQSGNSRTGEIQGSLSNAVCKKIMLQPDKDHLQVSENKIKALQSSKSDKLNFVPEEAGGSNIVKSSGIYTPTKSKRAESNSSLENSKNTVFSSKRVARSQSQENHEVGAKPQTGNSRTGEIQGPLSNAESEKIILKPYKDHLQVSENRVKTLQSSKCDKLNSIRKEARGSNIVKPSGINTPAKSKRAESNSSLENSKNTVFSSKRITRNQSQENRKHMDGRKKSTINSGEVVDRLQHEKSLIGVPGSIFKDDSDVASLYEDDNSDASTRTPSDKSLSSDYSDGESNADFNLSQNGSYSWKGKEGSGKTFAKPLKTEMTLDMILRSSSSYKKAMLTASQSPLEDTESQPVDFVPDSQADC